MPKDISVVVPTYRRPALLANCIDSLVRQSFPSDRFEIIIISDGPDEETASLVSGYRDRSPVDIHYLSLTRKKGPAAARNAGWQNAKGELIAFTDDDCITDSACLENYWSHFTAAGGAVAFTGRVVVPVSHPPTDYELNIRHLETAEFVTANCACSRLALLRTGGFDEAFSMAWREDSDLHFALLRQDIAIHKVIEAVVIHPVREARWGVSLKEQRKSMFNALLYKKYPRLYRERIQRHAPWHYYIIIASFIAFLASAVVGATSFMLFPLLLWAGFTLLFVLKRVRNTSKSLTHLSEMLVTSAVIPFLSVYWRLYGAVKFRTLFL
jgi:glycosyltransferase involved in cell wall biosynthesis